MLKVSILSIIPIILQEMEAATYDLAPYLKLMSPPKSTTALLQEIHYNTAATQSLYSSIESDEFCTKQNIEECLQYLDKVSTS